MIYQYLKVFYSRIAEQYSTQLGINHYLVMGMGIQVCSNEGARLFKAEKIVKIIIVRNCENTLTTFKKLLQNCVANFNQTW